MQCARPCIASMCTPAVRRCVASLLAPRTVCGPSRARASADRIAEMCRFRALGLQKCAPVTEGLGLQKWGASKNATSPLVEARASLTSSLALALSLSLYS